MPKSYSKTNPDKAANWKKQAYENYFDIRQMLQLSLSLRWKDEHDLERYWYALLITTKKMRRVCVDLARFRKRDSYKVHYTITIQKTNKNRNKLHVIL